MTSMPDEAWLWKANGFDWGGAWMDTDPAPGKDATSYLRAENVATQLAAKDKEIERLKAEWEKLFHSEGHYVATIAQLREALTKIEPEARRYATMYPEGSDGRNTFILFAEWAERTTRAALTEEPK